MKHSKKKLEAISLDRSILLPVLALLGVGLVQVYSASFIFAIDHYKNGLHFFNKQLVFAVLGIGLMFFVAHLKWKWSQILGVTLFIMAFVGLILTFVSGFAIEAGGAHRWIRMPFGQRFEPSELFKMTYPFYLAILMVLPMVKKLGAFDPILRVGAILVPLILLHKQPDFGSLALVVLTTFSILFVFGLQWRFIFASALASVPVFYFLVVRVPYRWARVKGFLDPWADPSEKGFQILQSLMSFQSGGIWGSGLGEGQGKLFFLPEAHTDFTLAVLGEEVGLIGFITIFMLYGFLIFRGLQVSSYVRDTFAKVVALGVTLMFTFQVFINVGVVFGVLPTKGLTLPFLSYGGSSLVATCLGFGWLLNIEKTFLSKKIS